MTDFEKCPDCSVRIGETHFLGCDISRCKNHGYQLLKCLLLQNEGECSPTKFDGYFPGTLEAIERGWFTYLDKNNKWQKCDGTAADAQPDINKVITELTWDPKSERFV